ncbi:hypothetical protein DL767_003923 [Monosporascus sp. MG133]|nr:hypothetical protein DL767_003923 [Monosporascus sp. MG133]
MGMRILRSISIRNAGRAHGAHSPLLTHSPTECMLDMEGKKVDDCPVTRGYRDEETVAIGLLNCPSQAGPKQRSVMRRESLAVFAPQVDRGNISDALRSAMTHDLGVMTNQINVGHALMSTEIVLLEIPSNLSLQRICAPKRLSAQLVTRGLVAALLSFMANFRSCLVTLALLGLREEGFIPGALYTMSTLYKMSESNLRITLCYPRL